MSELKLLLLKLAFMTLTLRVGTSCGFKRRDDIEERALLLVRINVALLSRLTMHLRLADALASDIL